MYLQFICLVFIKVHVKTLHSSIDKHSYISYT